ncbi:MAG: ABC transporter permease, partial [Pseudomonadota bacterium]|nr:ABC transporter permease [Pseudomonadota bacterium]
YNFSYDKRHFDEAARTLYYFDVLKAPLEQANKSINIDKLHRYARTLALEANQASKQDYIATKIMPFFAGKQVTLPELTLEFNQNNRPISDVASMRRGSVYFLLVAASIWLGIISSCKEVVTEQPVLKRELRAYLLLSPYLAAKASVLAFILAVHTGLLAVIVVPLLLELSWLNTLWVGVILWIAAFTATALGLLISSVVKSYRVALTLVPLVMIPQLLFGGLLRPQVELATHHWESSVANALSALTIQRWAFEAILTTDNYAQGGVLKLHVNPQGRGELDLVKAQNTALVQVFFHPRAQLTQGWLPLIYLLGASLVFLMGGYWALRWRLT